MGRAIGFVIVFLCLGAIISAHGLAAAPDLSPGVSHDLAIWRAAHYSKISYSLNLTIAPGAPLLIGSEEVHVTLANEIVDLVIDWRVNGAGAGKAEDQPSRISNLTVNGKAIADPKIVSDHLVIPAQFLRRGENIVQLSFASPISASGSAVTRYQDHEDGSEYIYTLFVPSDASTAFPCIDQPDLKARFKLELTAPTSWQVVTNTAEEETKPGQDTKLWRFGLTEPISTYLFAFAAGPFAQLTDDASTHHTHMFVRRSKLERARQEQTEVLRLTRECVAYFEKYFDFKYPFPKYDLVLIPEFAYGGMEHAGATFLNEDGVLFPSEPTASDFLSRAQLIFHETAHQWFGDLVTMRWFDDLWLKEGFATFMGYKATEAILPQFNAWKAFYQRTKPAAYTTDATLGTTPIFQDIPNLSAAKSAYGNIVYNKAPAMLRQAEYYLGKDHFQKAVQMLVKQHAYANASWADLVHDWEQTSGQSLDRWADAWVKRRGMPDISVDWSVGANDKIDHFVIRQKDVLKEGTSWPMATQVLLYYDGQPARTFSVRLDSAPQATIKEIIGQPRPAFIYANYEDYGYGRFLLDAQSRTAVVERIGGIQDSFLRAVLWGSLWDSVREAEWSPSDYLNLSLKLVAQEKDELSAQSILGRTQTAFNRYLSPKQQSVIAPQVENLLFDQMIHAENKGSRITYFRSFSSCAVTPEARSRLKQILAGTIAIPGFQLKSRDRFDIASTLLARNDDEAPALLVKLSQADKTDNGRRYSYAAGAGRAAPEVKKEYFNAYLHDTQVPESWVEASLGPFNAIEQSDLSYPYLQQALEALPQMKRQRKIFFVNRWLGAFIGGQCSERARDVVQSFLNEAQLDRDLRLKVLEAKDGLDRCVRIHAKYDGGDRH